jgi:hypothetical protein
MAYIHTDIGTDRFVCPCDATVFFQTTSKQKHQGESIVDARLLSLDRSLFVGIANIARTASHVAVA